MPHRRPDLVSLTAAHAPRFRFDSRLAQLAVAVLTSVAGILAGLVVERIHGHPPGLMLLLVPVLVSAYLGGLWAGLMATASCAVFADLWMVEPRWSLAIGDPEWILRLLVFIGVGVFASLLSEGLRRAREAGESGQAIRDAVLASLDEAVVALTADGRIWLMNAEAERLCGHSFAQARGRSIAEVCPGIDPGQRGPQVPGVESPDGFRCFILRLEGREVPVAWRERVVHDASGRTLATLIVVRDQSAGEAARRERESLETRLAAVAATAPGVLYTFRREPDGRIEFPFVGPGFEELLGVPAAEAQRSAEAVYALVHPDDVHRMFAASDESMRDLSPWRLDFRILHPRRGELVIAANSRPHREPDGAVVWHGVLTEVTDRVRAVRALEESEARFRSYVESAPDPVIVLDRDGRFEDFNRAALELYGCSAERLRASTMVDFLHPDDRERAFSMRASEVEGGFVEGELRKITADGRTIWVAVRGTSLGDGTSLAHLRDVTASRAAARVLAEQEARFRSYVENAPDAIIVIDREGHFLDFNQAALRLHNCTAEELAAGTIYDFMPPEDRPLSAAHRSREQAAGKVEVELRIVPKGRGPVWVALRGARLDDGTSLAYLRDVTERHLAADALAESEARFRSYVESAPDAVVVIDVEGRFLDFNAAALELHGASGDELRALSMFDFTLPEERERIRDHRAHDADPGSRDGEFRLVSRTRGVRWVSVRSTALGSGRSLAHLRDITEHKLAVEALAESEARFRSYVESAPDAVVVVDGEGRFLEFNEAAVRLHGVSAEVLRASRLFDFHPAREHGRITAQRTRELGEAVVEDEFELERPDGELRWVSVRATALGDGRSLAHLRDVTAQKLAAQALAASEARFRSYVERAPDGIVVLGPGGTFVTHNEAAARIFGYGHEEFGRLSVLELVADEDRAEVAVAATRFKDEGLIAGEWRHRTKDGRIIWVAFRAARVDDTTALAYLRDVTERHLAADALAASEARFRSYIQHAPDAVVVVTDEARFRAWNPAAAALLGRSDEDIRRLPIVEAFGEEDRERVALDVVRLFRGETVEGEYQVLRADGHVTWVVIRASRLADGTGLAYIHDITARRRIEQAVHESEARLKAIIDSAMDGIVSIDEDQRIVLLNPAAEQMFGTSFAQVRGQPIGVLLPEDKREGHVLHVDAFARGFTTRRRVVSQTQVVGRRASGELFPIEASISQVQVGGRKLFTAVVRDITARLKAQQALHESDERFRQLAESVREVFWLSDLATDTVIYVSPAYETVWGRTCASVSQAHQDWAKALHPEDRDRVLQARRRQAAGNYDEEYRIVRPDGSIRWIRDQAFPVRDPEGRVIRIAGVAEDITERRALESQLRQTQKMESIGLLAGGVAHDFNNLLTVIAGNTELLMADLPPDREPYSLAGEIQAAGERAASLTRQLLAFSRQQVLEPQVLDLNAVVTDTEKMLRRLVGEDIVLTTLLSVGNPRVHLDPGHLAQVIMNLAVNARDAMPRGGRLVISTGAIERDAEYTLRHPDVKPGPYVVLTVADTGSGMPTEVRERVFEPFFTTKGTGRGTGLGLSVVLGIVQQSGGHLELDSEVGVGTTFRLYFPAVVESIAARADGPAEAGAHGTETVLLVEDEEFVRRLGERALRSYGYRVLVAVDGQHALEVLSASGASIDLVVTDVVMPNMDGRDLSDRLRADNPSLKVLFTSGYTDDAVIRHGVDHAEVAFLQKPYTPLVLVRKVRDVLDRT